MNNSTGQCKTGFEFVLDIGMFFRHQFPGKLNMLLLTNFKKSFHFTTSRSTFINSAVYPACFLMALHAAYFIKKSGDKAGIIPGTFYFSPVAFLSMPVVDHPKDHYRGISHLYNSLSTSNQVFTIYNRKLFSARRSVGKKDLLYKSTIQFIEFPEFKNIHHKAIITSGGHTWMNCKQYLSTTSEEIFK